MGRSNITKLLAIVLLAALPTFGQKASGGVRFGAGLLAFQSVLSSQPHKNVPFIYCPSVVGGVGTYTLSVGSGTLPTGLSIAANCVTGTATNTTSQTVTLKVVDQINQYSTQAVTITPQVPTGIAITPSSATVATSSTEQMAAVVTWADGTTDDGSYLNWSSSNTSQATVTSPGGLVTAVASGSPTITANFDGVTSNSATITVPGTGAVLAVSTSSPLTDALPYQVYQPVTLISTGGSGCPCTWSITSGSLPSGLSLSTGGVISGTVSSSAATQSPTFQVTDSGSHTATAVLTINVSPINSITESPATATITVGSTQ